MSLKTLGSNGFQMKRVASTAMLNSTKVIFKVVKDLVLYL